MEVTYKVGDFKKLISESSNEFKAKIGDGVESENKKNNDKSYKETEKRVKDYKLDETEENTPEKNDGNKTTLDYNPENASKEYKERVHAQAKGYTSKDEENNGIEKTGEFSDKSYQAIKKSGQEIHKNIENLKKSGLQARTLPDGSFKKEDMYENKKIKTVFFKKTAFLNESMMIKRIPDEFKTEGNVFKMKDKNENSYLIEWQDNNAVIVEHSDKKGTAESVDRMKDLFKYSPKEYANGTDCISRINESNEEFKKTLDNIRKIIK